MFKFNFSDVLLEELPDEGSKSNIVDPQETSEQLDGTISQRNDESATISAPCHELSIEELTKDFPPALSYSPIVIPVGEGENRTTITLLRRDLFDARFQLIAQDAGQEDRETDLEPQRRSTRSLDGVENNKSEIEALAFIDNPTDLVPGVYEGGLKTWECSLDLVETLHNLSPGSGRLRDLKGKRVLEIGCGTAIPSLYLLNELFDRKLESLSGQGHEDLISEVVLQDYNDLVLRLVTFPNVLLTWYASPLAIGYRNELAAQGGEDEMFNPTEAGEIVVTSELMSSFLASLADNQIRVRFVSGSWDGMLHYNSNQVKSTTPTDLFTRPFNIVLTSETIYRLSSLPTLINLLRIALRGRDLVDICGHDDGAENNLEGMTGSLTISPKSSPSTLCLVAAKVLYFGVGGGIIDFERIVKNDNGRSTTVLEKTTGVGRRVLEVSWTQNTSIPFLQ